MLDPKHYFELLESSPYEDTLLEKRIFPSRSGLKQIDSLVQLKQMRLLLERRTGRNWDVVRKLVEDRIAEIATP